MEPSSPSISTGRSLHKTESSGSSKKLKHGAFPAGKPLVRIYDRVQERAAVGKPPPFGPSPVTRVELVKQLSKVPLHHLASLPDLLKELRVGLIQAQFDAPFVAPKGCRLRYAALRRTHSHEDASKLLSLQAEDAVWLHALEEVPNANLIAPTENWSEWTVGLKSAGLLKFLQTT